MAKTATKPADKLRYLLVADQDLSRQERLHKKWLTVTAHIRIMRPAQFSSNAELYECWLCSSVG
jgi:hypothetical protein